MDLDALLTTYVDGAIKSVGDATDEEEALDVLGEIVGTGTTREFVTQTRLLAAPLRHPARRDRALKELQKRYVIKGDNPRVGADKVFDVMHERLLGPLRQLLEDRPKYRLTREAIDRAVQPTALRSHLTLADCKTILAARKRLALELCGLAATILVSLMEHVNSQGENAARRFKDVASLADDPEHWWGSILTKFVATARGPRPENPSGQRKHVDDDWWMTGREIDQSLGPKGAPNDWHALASALHGRPSERNRTRMEQLIARIAA